MENESLSKRYFYNPECMERYLADAAHHKGGVSLVTSMALYSEKIEWALKKNLYELELDELRAALPLINRIYTSYMRRDASNIIKYMKWAHDNGLRSSPPVNPRAINFASLDMESIYRKRMLFTEVDVKRVALFNSMYDTVPTVAMYFILTWLNIPTVAFYSLRKEDFIYEDNKIIFCGVEYRMPRSIADIIQKYLSERIFFRVGNVNGRVYTTQKGDSDMLLMPEVDGIAGRDRADRGIYEQPHSKSVITSVNRQILIPFNLAHNMDIGVDSLKFSYTLYSIYNTHSNSDIPSIKNELKQRYPGYNQAAINDLTLDFLRYKAIRDKM